MSQIDFVRQPKRYSIFILNYQVINAWESAWWGTRFLTLTVYGTKLGTNSQRQAQGLLHCPAHHTRSLPQVKTQLWSLRIKVNVRGQQEKEMLYQALGLLEI